MSATDETVEKIKSIICQATSDIDLPEQDIVVLQSYSAKIVIPILLDIFNRSKDDTVQSRAYRQIIDFPKFDSVQFILGVFDQSDVNWQSIYCEDLSRFHDVRAIAKLCQVMLEHPDPDVRFNAAHSLMIIGDNTALPALENTSKNDDGLNYLDNPVADMAHTGLVKIGHKLHPTIEKFTRDLYFRRGASREMIETIETKYHIRFPEDYKEFLLISNGAFGFVGEAQVTIYPLDLMDTINQDVKIRERIPPGFLEFGMNSYLYAFDIRQASPVFVAMPRMNAHPQDIRIYGFTFSEFLEYLFDRPYRPFPFRYTPDGELVPYRGE